MKCIIFTICILVVLCKSNYVSENKDSYSPLNQLQKGEQSQDEKDFFFQDTNYGELSVGVQNLFVTLTEGIQNLEEHISRVETKLEAVLDRLNHVDCYDLKMQDPLRTSGAYVIYLSHLGKRPVNVYCDMVTLGGGWTVIQQRLHRDNPGNLSKIDFDRSYHDYQVGFGYPGEDLWIGLENLYVWTNTRPYELRIELEDFNDNTGHASYKAFSVGSEQQGYKLNIGDYSGDIGDSLANGGISDNFTADGMRFSTKDNDQDTSFEINCATYWDIGGWWYNRCSWANLNGPYRFPGEKKGIGINWHKWKNLEYIKSAVMMIRPLRMPGF